MKANNNQENLYEEVLKFLRKKTNDPSVIMTALGRAMLIILQAAQELCRERDETDVSKFRCFFAFSQEQLEQGQRSIKLKPNEKLVSFGGGGFGVEDGVNKYFAHLNEVQNRIRTECDPQEVYCYEFNNYESFIAFDGDVDAIRLIAAIWGQEAASRIKRFSPFYSLKTLFGEK